MQRKHLKPGVVYAAVYGRTMTTRRLFPVVLLDLGLWRETYNRSGTPTRTAEPTFTRPDRFLGNSVGYPAMQMSHIGDTIPEQITVPEATLEDFAASRPLPDNWRFHVITQLADLRGTWEDIVPPLLEQERAAEAARRVRMEAKRAVWNRLEAHQDWLVDLGVTGPIEATAYQDGLTFTADQLDQLKAAFDSGRGGV